VKVLSPPFSSSIPSGDVMSTTAAAAPTSPAAAWTQPVGSVRGAMTSPLDERIDRRRFLVSAAAVTVGASLANGWWRAALAAPATPGELPYGPLATTPDPNGLLLPDGFRSRVIAFSGEPVAGTDYVWHTFPDGGATFRHRRGGWVYVSNSEVSAKQGGVGAVRFAPDGEIADAYRILDGTDQNCAGGPTPWGTWLSCEEHEGGHVWECDPTKVSQGVDQPALGTFTHEAAAVDPRGKAVYLTEDHPDGRLYRFVPTEYPDLRAGTLQAAHVDGAGAVTFVDVSPDGPERSDATTSFDSGEGMFHDRGTIVFTTKGDNRVWALDPAASTVTVLYDPAAVDDPPLTGVDNITVHHRSRDLYVAEDGGNMELVLITAPKDGSAGVVAPFLALTGTMESEIAGPAFDPSGRRLYFSSQRGTREGLPGPGLTFEVTGPVRGTRRARR
jgi:secreted PhoX family phosphatase